MNTTEQTPATLERDSAKIGLVGEIFRGVGPFKDRLYRTMPDGRKVRIVRMPGPISQAEASALEQIRITKPHDIVEAESGRLSLRPWGDKVERGVALLTIGGVEYYPDGGRVRGRLTPSIVTADPPADPTLEHSPEMSADILKSKAGETLERANALQRMDTGGAQAGEV